MKTEKTHWLQSPNKNYLGHWDLPEKQDLTLTIDSAQWEPVDNPITNKSEAKRVIRFKEDVKPFICNQTNAMHIIESTGVKYMEDSKGHQITMYIGSTKMMGKMVDCIRLREKIVPKKKDDTENERVISFIRKAKKEKSVPQLVAIEKNLIDNGKDTPVYLKLIEDAKTDIIDLKMQEDEI